MSELGEERVLVVGAGSLGSVYGGLLARAGHDVQLFAREPHARAITENGGLRLQSKGEETLVPLRADWRSERIEPADIAIVLTKSLDTRSALAGLDHVVPELRVAVSLQNSVEKDEILHAWAGRERVVGGMSMVGGTLVEPGYVHHTFDRSTVVGELPRGTSARIVRLAELLADAGLSGVASDNVLGVEWAKLIHALPSMALPALTRKNLHEILIDPDLARLYVALVREGVAVADAAGVEIDEGPLAFPLRQIAKSHTEEAIALVQEQGRRFVEAGMTEVRVSMLQSIESGRRLEVEAIHGYVVREAARLAVPVPTTESCYRMLAAIDRSFA